LHRQGREKDIAIFSAVRGNKGKKSNKGIGFVADERRVNVGLTRARASMLVIGNARTLEINEVWEALIGSARSRGCMYKVTGASADFIVKVRKTRRRRKRQ
jgi:senataxin